MTMHVFNIGPEEIFQIQLKLKSSPIQKAILPNPATANHNTGKWSDSRVKTAEKLVEVILE